MIARAKLNRSGGNYFAAPDTEVEFFSSGCQLLDCALGGGWARNRIANVVGDKSTGKTLLAIEACANFAMTYAAGLIYYREAEAAFQRSYASALGMPLHRVDFGTAPLRTAEDLFEDLSAIIKRKRKVPVLYILDSLDALSDRAEVERAIDAGSYGAQKAKKMSEMFRRLVGDMHQANVTLIIISQVRSRIGMLFGPQLTRTGGRALDFYASQVIYLSQRKTLVRKIGKVTRVTGMWVHAKVDKNKVSVPFREADFPIKFGYGVDDHAANVAWLKLIGIGEKEIPKDATELNNLVVQKWWELEKSFLPTKRKYA